MKRQNHLNSKLKKADVELVNYILELEKEIARLQKYNAHLEVKDVSQQAQISELKKMKPKVIVNIDGLDISKKKK